ncbi:MAG: flavin reductase family protein [Geminicoccaceae bacterium]|nr:MAG: flavin reductase family protein [Geminicoccaceae bacterium]
MFYRTDQPHGLPHNPFNALVVPRPIGWISTVDRDGRANLAPYSFFNAVAYTPPQVVFSGTGPHGAGGGLKDSIQNVIDTGEFVCNFVSVALDEAMNQSSSAAPRGVDEFEVAGLTKAPSELVKPPRVKESLAHLECTLLQVIELATLDPVAAPNRLVIGKVVGVHIDDTVLTDGRVDMAKLRPLARLGYMDYAPITEVFEMQRPSWPPGA